MTPSRTAARLHALADEIELLPHTVRFTLGAASDGDGEHRVSLILGVHANHTRASAACVDSARRALNLQLDAEPDRQGKLF